nr:hypothetical protein [uncultured bacterium]
MKPWGFAVNGLVKVRRRRNKVIHPIRSHAAAAALAVLAMLGAGLHAAPASAAGASALTPLQRCQQGLAPNQSETVTHYGNQVGVSFPNVNNPYNAILPGDVVKVTVWGTVSYDLWGNSVGPNGNDIDAPSGWPFPGLNQYASIARWNNNPGGWVGSPMQTNWLAGCNAAPSIAVRLLYYINDGALWDNGGQWFIKTEVFWP